MGVGVYPYLAIRSDFGSRVISNFRTMRAMKAPKAMKARHGKRKRLAPQGEGVPRKQLSQDQLKVESDKLARLQKEWKKAKKDCRGKQSRHEWMSTRLKTTVSKAALWGRESRARQRKRTSVVCRHVKRKLDRPTHKLRKTATLAQDLAAYTLARLACEKVYPRALLSLQFAKHPSDEVARELQGRWAMEQQYKTSRQFADQAGWNADPWVLAKVAQGSLRQVTLCSCLQLHHIVPDVQPGWEACIYADTYIYIYTCIYLYKYI